MEKRKRKSGRGASTIFLVVVLIICGGAFYWYLDGRGTGDDAVVEIINEKPTKVQELTKTKNDVTTQLENSNDKGKYGVWPIKWSDIDLSRSRGNPFAEKRTVTINRDDDPDQLDDDNNDDDNQPNN